MGKRIVFPVPGGKFTNDWGAARADTGTHKGNDIFAPRGTPVYAVEDGTITKIGYQRIGGNRLWLNGKWYYAHLDSYAKGLRAGSRVKAGQIIGYVGDTGDAKGTPTHLHFGYAPGGYSGDGSWVNPFPYLTAAEKGKPIPSTQTVRSSDRTSSAAGSVPGTQVEMDRASAVGENLGGISGGVDTAAQPTSAVLEPGSVAPQPAPPQSALETWRLIAGLPNSSPDAQRYLTLAQIAEGPNGA